MIWSALKAKAAPYTLLLKFGLLAVACLFALRVGCSLQADRDAKIIADKDAALVKAAGELRAAGHALDEVNANTAAEIARAEANRAANAQEAELAKERAEAYRELLVQIEADVDKAARASPACRARLEERPCAQLR